jgi:hypothetical protein
MFGIKYIRLSFWGKIIFTLFICEPYLSDGYFLTISSTKCLIDFLQNSINNMK